MEYIREVIRREGPALLGDLIGALSLAIGICGALLMAAAWL